MILRPNGAKPNQQRFSSARSAEARPCIVSNVADPNDVNAARMAECELRARSMRSREGVKLVYLVAKFQRNSMELWEFFTLDLLVVFLFYVFANRSMQRWKVYCAEMDF